MRDLSKFDDFTIEPARYGNGVSVYGFGVYPRSSVLAGQTSKNFLDGFDTEAEALAAYPQARVGFRDACNTFSHLPGEDDPVPGGMYPDDIGGDDYY